MAVFPTDLRKRILASYERGEGTRDQIASRSQVSLGRVKKLIQQRRHGGDIAPRHHPSGRKRKILESHKKVMNDLLGSKPDMTLEELRDATGLFCTLPAIHYAPAAMELKYKKALSASEQDRSDVLEVSKKWRGLQGGLGPARLVFIDESGAKTNMTRLRGRARQAGSLRRALRPLADDDHDLLGSAGRKLVLYDPRSLRQTRRSSGLMWRRFFARRSNRVTSSLWTTSLRTRTPGPWN
ncbi:MAG: transcriptional regulator [Akkermansiaceae bacterium]|nr:transcriptional regulator [Akkermansiaceae bacterium]